VFFGGLDGFAYALDAQTGELIWKRDLGGKVTTSAAIKGRDLYLGTAKRQLYRLNTGSGEILGETATQATPFGQLILASDSLFVFLGDELLASFDLDLKKPRWNGLTRARKQCEALARVRIFFTWVRSRAPFLPSLYEATIGAMTVDTRTHWEKIYTTNGLRSSFTMR